MKKISILLLLLTNFYSCSKENSIDVDNTTKSSLLKKVIIRQGENLDNRVTIYSMEYDRNLKLKTLEVNQEDAISGTSYAKYTIELDDNNEISRCVLDCSESDCGWNFGILPENYVEVVFERNKNNNGTEQLTISQNELDNNGKFIGWITGTTYLVNPNNLIIRKENTDILYENENIKGISNDFSFNDGLEYFDYDDKPSVVIYTDDIGVINSQEYIYRLILNLKYSVNNYTRMRFDYKSEDQYISFEYDENNRPKSRKVVDKYNGTEQLKYEETYEYLD
ncbi:hypothetical protein [Maribacter sp. 2210JD10-5]|uniref:hypothetical protein n=1 Tax=Maribacter sp. 2210JD10-5 TaxID=3386272 RepID=UPI0039BCB205